MIGWGIKHRRELDAIIGLGGESDRAAAIVAATIVEDRLERKLKTVLRNSKSVFELLFSSNRPLHFVSARNHLAYLMRVYGKPFYQEMGTIGSIRNKFAHIIADDKDRPVKDFKSPIIQELCDELKLLKPILLGESKSREVGSTGKSPSWAKIAPQDALSDPKTKYLMTCALCAGVLSGHLDQKIIKAVLAETAP